MMRILKVLVLIFGLSIFANAQKAVLSGTVTDKWGAIIPNAMVEAKNVEGKIIWVRANDDGAYKLELIKGEYRIEITKLPFGKFSVSNYWLTSGMQLDASLQCTTCELIDQDMVKPELTENIKNGEAMISNNIMLRPLEKLPKKLNKTKRKNNK